MTAPPRPEISILLPAFNAGSTLDTCLQSIRRQTESRWECLVVDDGSTDDTGDVAERFAEADSRFRLIRIDHIGLVGALGIGLEHCRGRYVARMDADDLMHSRRLAEQARSLDSRPDLCGLGCHVRLFPRAGLTDGRRDYERWLNAIDAPERVDIERFIECPIAHPTLMIRRNRLLELGYRDRGWPEDYDLILRLLAGGDRVGILPRRRLAWRDQPERLSRTAAPYRQERFTDCKAWFLAAGFLDTDDRYILWGHGGTGRALRQALRKLGKRPSHIVEVHQGRIGNRIDEALVIPPDDLPKIERRPLVVSVAGTENRQTIRDALTAIGFVEGRDYFCAA